jgi:AcrR family transcriptional regulator
MAVKKDIATCLALRAAAAGHDQPLAAEILRAAAEVFHESGYHAASMEKIADRVGLLKPALSR